MSSAVDQRHAAAGTEASKSRPESSAGLAPLSTAGLASTGMTSRTSPNANSDTQSPTRTETPQDEDLLSSTVSPNSITSPPYWRHANADTGAQHRRGESNGSADSSLAGGGITLLDNETTEHNDRSDACWARSVEIAGHTVVNGSATNIGAFVVWNVRVETLSGSYMMIRKRYSEFDDFRNRLVQSFPDFQAAVPELPPKSVISKFRRKFLDKRRAGLQYFLNCILLNPEFSGSPVLKEFLFA